MVSSGYNDIERDVRAIPGDASKPLSAEEVAAKFMRYAQVSVPNEKAFVFANAVLSADASDDAELAEIQTLLRGWDRRAASDSPAAALVGLIYQPIYNAGRAATDPPDPIDAARAAAARLRQHFGRIDPPLGDVLRLRRGNVDLPLEGAPDVLRAVRWADEPDGRAAANFGDGFMMVMDWAPDGSLSTRVIHQWGASERPTSAHFNDQSAMFSRREWRTLD